MFGEAKNININNRFKLKNLRNSGFTFIYPNKLHFYAFIISLCSIYTNIAV